MTRGLLCHLEISLFRLFYLTDNFIFGFDTRKNGSHWQAEKNNSSIGDGGSGPCCAKNPTQKNVPKTPPRKKPV